ncbi:MAG: hypothetical protein QXX17_01610 [Conexivisphaerales archaeon]
MNLLRISVILLIVLQLLSFANAFSTHSILASEQVRPVPTTPVSLPGVYDTGIPHFSQTAQPSSSSPSYDEQLGETFTQSFKSMAYNVTAVAQVNNDGYGPAYLLNGLSNTGYWYQVGLSYDWTGPVGGFQMVYEVFDPNGVSIFPANGEGGLMSFSGTVKQGDTVLLNLYIGSGSLAGEVVMYVKDYTSGAFAYETYSSEGSSYFVGNSQGLANNNGFFTGLMTEEYHNNAYYGNEQLVSYSNYNYPLTSAWLWIDEWNVATNQTLFSSSTSFPVDFSNSYQYHKFSSNNATEYANAFVFATGADNAQVSLQGPLSLFTDEGLAASGVYTIEMSGGQPPYNCSLIVDNRAISYFTLSSNTLTTTLNFGQLSLGSHAAYLNAVDALGFPASSQTIYISVNPDPTLSVTAQSVADQGQTINVGISAQGGTLPYTKILYLNGQQVSGTAVKLSTLGLNQIYVILQDAAGYKVTSNTISVMVNPDPQASLTRNRTVLDAGQNVGFAANISFGTQPYQIAWYVNGTPVLQANGLLNYTLTPAISGQYNISLSITDEVGFTTSASSLVEVNADPVITNFSAFPGSSNFLYSNNFARAKVSSVNGTTPYTYIWYLNGAEIARTNAPTLLYNFTTMGPNTLQVKVSDAAGYTIASRSITVNFSYDYLHISGIAAVLLVVSVLLVLLLRRRKASSGVVR